ncbi:MAG: DUF3786 domain-containing protein [Desulfobulbaceae bacterium]|nr:DUF3786 domain-containing protein [Desulfobulbaceae bacterium]
MHPFDILKRTPKTNCSQCGHPTCLAFAAAVAKTGEDARRCPFINLDGLEIVAPQAATLEEIPRKQDLALIEHLKEKTAALDLNAIAAPLGATANSEGILLFRYLGRQVHFSKKEIRLDGEQLVDPRDQILLYNYVFSSGGRRPANDWIGMESLPNSISKIKTLTRYCEEKLAPCLAGRAPEAVQNIVRRLEAVVEPDPSATLALTVPVLPMIPERIIFWDAEPEDGFPARVKVLFDRHVLDFLDLESLVFTAERMAEYIIEISG